MTCALQRAGTASLLMQVNARSMPYALHRGDKARPALWLQRLVVGKKDTFLV